MQQTQVRRSAPPAVHSPQRQAPGQRAALQQLLALQARLVLRQVRNELDPLIGEQMSQAKYAAPPPLWQRQPLARWQRA